jgi:hypothetical protein
MYWIASGEGTTRMVYSLDGINWSSAIDTDKVFTSRAMAVGSSMAVKYNQTLTFNSFTKNISDSNFTPEITTDAIPSYSSYSFSVPANNGVVSVVNNQIQIDGLGSVVITAVQAENDVFNSATATATITVTKFDQILTFNTISKTIEETDFTPVVSTNTTLITNPTFTFTSSNPSVAIVVNNGTQLRIIGIGTSTITASQAGNEFVNSATATSTMYVTNYLLTVVGTTGNMSNSVYNIYNWNGAVINRYIDANGNVGVNSSVYDFTKDIDGNLYFVGSFTGTIKADGSPGTVSAGGVIKWSASSSTWEQLEDSNGNSIDLGDLYQASICADTLGNIYIGNNGQVVYKWNISTSTLTSKNIGSYVAQILLDNNNQVIFGTYVGDVVVAIKVWDPIQDTVTTLTDSSGYYAINGTFREMYSDNSGNLYISVTHSDSPTISNNSGQTITINGIVKWNATTNSFQALVDSAGNNGLIKYSYDPWVGVETSPASIETMMVYNDILYLGGDFNRTGGTSSITTDGLIQWNPSTNTWSSVSGGDFVSTMNVLGNTLFMGRFDQGLFSWNGTTLTTVTNTPSMYIRSLNGDVYDKDILNQTLTFNDFSVTYGVADFTPTVTTSASPSYSSYTFSLVTPGNSVATIADNKVRIIGAGETYIRVTQAANTTYMSATTTAKLTVDRDVPSYSSAIDSPDGINYTYGISGSGYLGGTSTTIALNTLVNSNSDGTLAFSITGANPINCAEIDSDNPNNLNFSQTGSVNIEMIQQEGTNYLSATRNFTVTLNRADQTLTFSNFNKNYGDAIFTPTVSTDANPSYSSYTFELVSSNGVASVVNNSTQIQINKVGTEDIRVTQAQSTFYNSATATATMTVLKIDPTLAISRNLSYTYGSQMTPFYTGNDVIALNELVSSNSTGTINFSISDATPSGCAEISLSNANNLVFTQAGSVTISITQNGDDNYNAITTPITFELTLNKASSNISGATQKSFTYAVSASGYAPSTNSVNLTELGITSDSSGTLSYSIYSDPSNVGTLSGDTLTFSQVGTVTIQVDQTSGIFHNELNTLVTFDVVLSKGSQTVSFSQSERTIENLDNFNNRISLIGYASSTTSTINPIQYSLYNVSTTIAQIQNQILFIYSYGIITLRASQNGSTNYEASPIAEQIITVKLSQDLSFAGWLQIYPNSQVGDTYPLTGYATSSTNNPIQYVLVDTPSSVAEIQTTRSLKTRDNNQEVVSEQVLVINGPGSITLKAIQAEDEGYSQTETTDLTNWRYIGLDAFNIVVNSTGQFVYRSFINVSFVQRSIDGGATWTDIRWSPDGYDRLGISGNGMVVTINNEYSLDGGLTWNTFNYPTGIIYEDIKINNTGTLWYTWTNDNIYKFHISTDYGQTWTQVYAYSGSVNNNLNNICMSDNGLILMFCTQSGVYISVNGGSWNKRAPITITQSSSVVFTSADCDTSGSIIYLSAGVALGGNIYRSEDRGKHWYVRSHTSRWDKVVCDSSGKLVVTSESSSTQGKLWTSTNSANIWAERSVSEPINGTIYNFSKMAISRNGAQRIFAIGGGIAGKTALCTPTSASIVVEFPQFVSYVENLTRQLPKEEGLIIEEIEESEYVADNTRSRSLTMTPETLVISNVISGSTVSLQGLAVSDTQNLNPITYEAVDTNCASISGTTMTILEPGTFTLKAYQVSYDFYSRSNEAEKQVTIVFSKSIWFVDKPIIKNYGDAPFVPEVETLLAGSYTFSLPANNGVATTNGTTVTIIGGGTVTLTVTQIISGTNGNYSSNTDTVELTVNPIDQILTFNPMTKEYRQTFVPVVSTNATPSYSSYTFSVPNNNGVVITNNNGTSLTVIGLGEVTVTVFQAANANYNSATTTATLTAVRANQTLTFENIYKSQKSSPFTPVVSTNAYPSYSSYTFSVPPNNNVATVDNNVFTILGMGNVQVTVHQDENELYNSATATATLVVISRLKRSRINLYDEETSAKHFVWSQGLNSTLAEFPGLVTFYEPKRNILIDDVIGRLQRYQMTADSTSYFYYEIANYENRIDALSLNLDDRDFGIQLLENREHEIETELSMIDLEQQDIQNKTISFASYFESIENEIDLVYSYTDRIEDRIQVSENRSSLLEKIIVETESNTSQVETHIIDTGLELLKLEGEIDILESRFSQTESDVDILESRESVMDTDILQLNSTIGSLAQHVDVFNAEMNSIETRISNIDISQSRVGRNLSLLEMEMNTNDSAIEDIKSVLFAMADGNLTTHLSTLQDITEQFNNTVNGEEDLVEMQERISILESIIIQLALEKS